MAPHFPPHAGGWSEGPGGGRANSDIARFNAPSPTLPHKGERNQSRWRLSMNEIFSESTIKAVVSGIGFATLLPFMKWATKPETVRLPASRCARFTDRLRWLPAPFIGIYVFFALFIPPVGGLLGDVGLLLIAVFVIVPLLMAYAMSRYHVSWNRDGITRQAWLFPARALRWDEINSVYIRDQYWFRFADGQRKLTLGFEAKDVPHLVRYARCRLKKNPRVVWDVL
jgi:hypothetical protein